MPSWDHVVAVVAGAARSDGDVHAHFGSLLGFDQHLDVARRLGLVRAAPGPVTGDAPEFVLTDAGREFVTQFRLTDLPAGRANDWSASMTEPATIELARRWGGVHERSARRLPRLERSGVQ